MLALHRLVLSHSLQHQRPQELSSLVRRQGYAQETGIYFNDPSGDNLREWLGINRETFYHSGLIAVVPMDFYYPGKARSGDLPPRAGFAQKWHPDILRLMPKAELFILIGAYAQHFYLKQKSSVKVTDNVKHFGIFYQTTFQLCTPHLAIISGKLKIRGLRRKFCQNYERGLVRF